MLTIQVCEPWIKLNWADGGYKTSNSPKQPINKYELKLIIQKETK